MAGLKTVVLFTRDEVRLTDSGDVLTGTHNEVIQIKKKPGRCTRVNFRSDMTSDEVRTVLENNFPVLQNRRFSCAARATQHDARLDFRGERRVWDGETIRKLKGKSVLYLVMEDEASVIREVFCPTESASSMQDHSWYNSNNSVHDQQLLPQSAPISFSSGANCNTKANVEDKSNLDVEIPLSPFFNESFDFEESMDGDFPQLPPGYLDDLLGMDSTQQNSQSQIAQGESFAGLENHCSSLGLTDQTSNPMILPGFNNAWNGAVGATPPIAQVLQSQPYQNQVSEARSTYTDTDGPSESGFSSQDCFEGDDLLDGMDSTQRNGQSQITQGGSFPRSADFENCCSGLGSTVQTCSPMTSPAFNNDWNGTVGAMPSIAQVLAPSQAYQNQVSEACSINTDISEPPERGFSSEGNSSIDGQALDLPQSIPPEASVEVKPSKGPLEGGGVFQLKFNQSPPDTVTSAWATFGNKQVEVWKTHESSFILYGETPAGDKPGPVTVTVRKKNGDYLGKTLFTYVDQDEEMLMQMLKSKKLQGKLFTMLGKQCENDESEENNSQTFGLPSDGRQRQAMDLLRCLVYTAAGIGAEEFLRMIFSTSAGRIVFEAYKKESTLPEDMADENGHEGIATFLRAITKRFSEEDTTSQLQSGGINWRNLARAVEESEEQSVSWPSEKDIKQLKEDDLSEREYFGDAETSSSDSEKERCDYEDQFEARFSKDQEPIQMGLDPSHQKTVRDIRDYQLPEKIGDKWKDLARALDSSDHCQANINRIEKNQGGSTKECYIEVLKCWMGREGRNATIEKLAEALVKAELKNIADELMCMDTVQGSNMRHTIEELEDKLTIASEKYEETERENSKMQSEIKQLETGLLDSELKDSKVRRTITKIEIKYRDADQQNSEMLSKMALLETRLQDFEHENSKMRSKIEQLETGLLDSELEGAKMRRTIKELEDNYQDAEREGSKMRHTIKELEDKLTIASEKCEETKRKDSKVRRTIIKLEFKYQDTDQQNSEMLSKRVLLETKLQNFEHENSKMRSKIEQLETGLLDSELEASATCASPRNSGCSTRSSGCWTLASIDEDDVEDFLESMFKPTSPEEAEIKRYKRNENVAVTKDTA